MRNIQDCDYNWVGENPRNPNVLKIVHINDWYSEGRLKNQQGT